MQLVNRDDKGQTPNEAISNITRKAKITAMDEEIPIVLLCQLNRNCETRGTYSFRHQLSDLRDSGSIEQDADIVLFLYREGYYDKEGGEDSAAPTADMNSGECIVAKNRHGETGTVNLRWNGQYTLFLSEDRRPAPAE